jgi:beta-lactamase regulating signal transducer with metallopeptidase domain
MNPINEIVVSYVANVLWMTCVIAAVASLLAHALRPCPSSYRHALWVAALFLAVLVPFASLRGSRNNDEPRTVPVAEVSTLHSAETAYSGTSSWTLWRQFRHGSQPVQFGPIVVWLVVALYLSFICYRVLRLYRGWWSLRAVLQQSSKRPMPPGMHDLVEQCQSRLGLKPVPILWSSEGKGPATLGIRNPVLVLPDWFLSQASEDEISSTLTHELAHIRRRDFFWNLVYEVLILPISFHPVAALIKAHIDQTRELACDETAAASMPTRAQYARSLLSIAQSMAAKQRPATVGYAMGLFDANTLEDRIMNVFAKTNRIRKSRAQASAVGTLALLLVTCLGVSGFSIQVSQPSTESDLRQFVGTWHAKFKGKTFMTVELEKQNGKLTGSVSHGQVGVDEKTGEMTGAEERDGSDRIVEAKLTGGVLRITTKEEDSHETLQAEIKLTGIDQAEIRLLVPPEESVPAFKPWKLERAKVAK